MSFKSILTSELHMPSRGRKNREGEGTPAVDGEAEILAAATTDLVPSPEDIEHAVEPDAQAPAERPLDAAPAVESHADERATQFDVEPTVERIPADRTAQDVAPADATPPVPEPVAPHPNAAANFPPPVEVPADPVPAEENASAVQEQREPEAAHQPAVPATPGWNAGSVADEHVSTESTPPQAHDLPDGHSQAGTPPAAPTGITSFGTTGLDKPVSDSEQWTPAQEVDRPPAVGEPRSWNASPPQQTAPVEPASSEAGVSSSEPASDATLQPPTGFGASASWNASPPAATPEKAPQPTAGFAESPSWSAAPSPHEPEPRAFAAPVDEAPMSAPEETAEPPAASTDELTFQGNPSPDEPVRFDFARRAADERGESAQAPEPTESASGPDTPPVAEPPLRPAWRPVDTAPADTTSADLPSASEEAEAPVEDETPALKTSWLTEANRQPAGADGQDDGLGPAWQPPTQAELPEAGAPDPGDAPAPAADDAAAGTTAAPDTVDLVPPTEAPQPLEFAAGRGSDPGAADEASREDEPTAQDQPSFAAQVTPEGNKPAPAHDEPRVPRSPVPPVHRLSAPAETPGVAGPAQEPAATPEVQAPEVEPAAEESKRRGLSLKADVRLPSLKRRKTPDAPAKTAKRSRRSEKRGKSTSADEPVGEKSAKTKLGIPASLGIYNFKRGEKSETDSPKKEDGGSQRRLRAPSVGSLRSVKLTLPGRRGDGGTLVGLDIQPGSAVAVRVSQNGRLHVTEAVSVALPAGVVREGEVVDSEALGAALREMFAGAGLPRRVRVGLAGQRCVMRTFQVPPLKDRKELAQAVAFTASQEMPMPLDTAVTDFHALGVTETPAGPRERVVFVAAHQEPVSNLLEALRRAGLTAGGVDLSAFALIRALHRPDDDEATGCQLYLNVDGLTNIAIAEGTTCQFSRVAPIGCESMAGELAGERSISLDEARRELIATNLLDLENTESLDARTVLRDGLRDVATEVRSALDFHTSQEGPPVTGIVLSGAIAQVRGFADELGQTLGYDVVAREVDAAEANGVGAVAPCRLAIATGLSVAEVPR